MSAMKRRENTFRIDYANVPKMPSSELVHRFVGETLGLKRGEVLRIQYSRNLGVVYVKAMSLDIAQKVVEDNDNKHELTVDNKPYKLRLMMEDGAVDVKLFNLSEDVTNDKIVKFLNAYGETLSIREEVWDEKHFFPGLPTGVRIVRMIVKKNIPSYVNIDGETTMVSYFGQQHICRHCNEGAHNGVSCVQNKKLLVQKLVANNTSYADVARNPQSARPSSSASKALGPNLLGTQPGGPKQQSLVKPAQNTAEPSTSGLMAPPPSVLQPSTANRPSHNEQQTESDTEGWTRVTRQSSKKKKDGNETDSSTSSKSSHKRPVTKKSRGDGDNDSDDENLHP